MRRGQKHRSFESWDRSKFDARLSCRCCWHQHHTVLSICSPDRTQTHAPWLVLVPPRTAVDGKALLNNTHNTPAQPCITPAAPGSNSPDKDASFAGFLRYVSSDRLREPEVPISHAPTRSRRPARQERRRLGALAVAGGRDEEGVVVLAVLAVLAALVQKATVAARRSCGLALLPKPAG